MLRNFDVSSTVLMIKQSVRLLYSNILFECNNKTIVSDMFVIYSLSFLVRSLFECTYITQSTSGTSVK